MYIKIDEKPRDVIKHYNVRVETYTKYDVFLIHNETTGEIEMTSDGMSVNSYKECIDSVIRIFKEQMGLNAKGKKYQLGNQPEEYGLITKYLKWLPEGKKDWDHLFFPFSLKKETEVIIVDPEEKEKVIIIMHQEIIKDAFPMYFFGEERANNWHRFCIVSTKENPSERFIIPMH